MKAMTRPVWAEINLEAIAHNTREIRRVTRREAKVMAVVKANAYGHGALEVSRTVLENGADCLGVALLEEAQELRTGGVRAPVLIMGYTPSENAADIINCGAAQAVYTFDQALGLSRAGRRLGRVANLHIKIDSGMGRIGFLSCPQTVDAILKIASLPNVQVEGIFTHFATADERDKGYTLQQLGIFLGLVEQLENKGLAIPVKHAANSAAILEIPETHLNMVRPGIILYGYYPSGEVREDLVAISPAMTFKARLAFVKKVEAGAAISYGRTFIAPGPMLVASLPLGYADGYSRLLSNKAEVLVGGQRAPLVGRVCMDQFMVDVSRIPVVNIGDEVVLLGQQGDEVISAGELADKIGTISYEILCMISSRVPRRHFGEHTSQLSP
ncbi:MAG: alanine racemase [Bacillota bacterium]